MLKSQLEISIMKFNLDLSWRSNKVKSTNIEYWFLATNLVVWRLDAGICLGFCFQRNSMPHKCYNFDKLAENKSTISWTMKCVQHRNGKIGDSNTSSTEMRPPPSNSNDCQDSKAGRWGKFIVRSQWLLAECQMWACALPTFNCTRLSWLFQFYVPFPPFSWKSTSWQHCQGLLTWSHFFLFHTGRGWDSARRCHGSVLQSRRLFPPPRLALFPSGILTFGQVSDGNRQCNV